jgi:hypothetical protein
MGNIANRAQMPPAAVGFELTLLPRPRTRDSQKTFELDRTLRIGANSGNHIVISGPGVDPFHARFIPGVPVPVFDVGDAHATIDGLAVHGRVGLIPGDAIRIGENQLLVSMQGACAQTSSNGTTSTWRLVSRGELASIRLSDQVTIGSSGDCDIDLTGAGVAPLHAQLVLRQGALWIRDFSNGSTLVDELPVNGACQLSPGQTISIADHGFRIDQEVLEETNLDDGFEVVPAKTSIESAANDDAAVGTSPDDSVLVTAANWDSLAWEVDEPIAIPTEEGLLAENVARFGAQSARLDALPPVASVSPSPARAQSAVRQPLVAIDAAAASARGRGRQRASRRPSARLTALVFVVSLVAFVAVGSPENRDRIAAMLHRETIADAVDRVLVQVHSLQRAAIRNAPQLFASPPPPSVPDVAARIEPTTQTVALPVQPSGQVLAQATEGILALKAQAARGDASAKTRLAELGDFYDQLASSALERGDAATAQRQRALVALIRSNSERGVAQLPDTAEASGQAQLVTRREPQQHVSQPTVAGREAPTVAELVKRLSADSTDAAARTSLARAIDSLNVQLRDLISEHRFGQAKASLLRLESDGLPVLSHGNVRPRPQFVDEGSWHALAVSSLLVDADSLIQAGHLATLGTENAISRLEWATRLNPNDPLVDDMRLKTSGMLSLRAQEAARQGMTAEADRLSNLATYVRDGFQS